ncbi:membrane protein [Mycobacterium antarcticum]|uniref:hypothetical protein n=1 Tax=unclassified Mycolicibacterium TaxID=2636767 RepID=UPI00239CB762|nr:MULTISPECIES: hypothetical protein [unclassified Mycolicibacterium]BDX34838.1 membrane protein [Mycolicibacterium sp. TUM20985]GLP78039.1 membrane protein [Mycolicibacterium sp. TUM20983]
MPAYALALALAVTAPLLKPGYLLLRDAVSTPRSHLTDAALGLTEAAPRALPQDFAIALASHVVDGGVIVKLLLIAGLWLAGWGAARLAAEVVSDAGLPGQFVAATLAVWNPYVAERLLQGHWSLLVGYGCLPWVAVAVLRMGSGGPWWPVLFWTALAGLTPTGLMLAATVALVTCVAPGAGRSRRVCAAASLGAAVLGALPWLVAPMLAGSLSSTQAAGVTEFAARAEPGLGTLLSLAGLGGIWNGEAVPATRTTLFAIVATAVLLMVVVAGLPTAVRRPAARPLLILAAVAVLAPALMATGPGLAAVEALLRAVPGLGVLRDAQKWVALAVPGYALAGAAAVVTLQRRIPGVVTAAVCCLALVVVLPDLAWGVGGKVTSVRYPSAWPAAAALIDAVPGPVAVLPPDSMRQYPWAGAAPVLDPLPRWVSADVLTTGDLNIGGQTVPGEGRRAREVERLVQNGAGVDELARAGVGWVVVEGGEPRLDLPVAFAADDLTVYRVGGEHPAASHRGLVIAAHLVWLASLLAGAVGMIAAAITRRRRGAVY